MFRIAEKWKLELEEEYSDYYLAIWIFDPREAESQLVAAVGEKIGYYKNLFRERPCRKSFPCSITGLKERAVWKSYWDYVPYWKDHDEIDEKDKVYLKKMSAIEENVEGEIYYFIPKGKVWVTEEIPNKAIE